LISEDCFVARSVGVFFLLSGIRLLQPSQTLTRASLELKPRGLNSFFFFLRKTARFQFPPSYLYVLFVFSLACVPPLGPFFVPLLRARTEIRWLVRMPFHLTASHISPIILFFTSLRHYRAKSAWQSITRLISIFFYTVVV